METALLRETFHPRSSRSNSASKFSLKFPQESRGAGWLSLRGSILSFEERLSRSTLVVYAGCRRDYRMWIPHPDEGKREIGGKREKGIRVKIVSASSDGDFSRAPSLFV